MAAQISRAVQSQFLAQSPVAAIIRGVLSLGG
jgi:hypothetical protein